MNDVLKQALDALNRLLNCCDIAECRTVPNSPGSMKAARAAIAAIEQALSRVDEPSHAALKVVRGDICCKSLDHDQSYGMWIPVTYSTEHGFVDGTVFYTHPAQPAADFHARGLLAKSLKCWHRLTEEESDELVAFVAALQPNHSEVMLDMVQQKAEPVQEPFGFFRPEPCGWTDCAETDEGAIALYAAPQARQPLTQRQIDEAVCDWFVDKWEQKAARGMLEDLGIKGGDV